MHTLPHSVPQTLHQATANPHLNQRLLDSLSWGHCSFLLGPDAQGSVCALQESISQYCVSSGSSVVGLMVTSSKRAYAVPKSAAPRASAPVQDHGQPVPPQETLKHNSVSVSVGSPGPDVHKICLSPLSISGGNGV